MDEKMKLDRSEPLPIHRTPCDCEENGQCNLIGGRCTIDSQTNPCQLWRPKEAGAR